MILLSGERVAAEEEGEGEEEERGEASLCLIAWTFEWQGFLDHPDLPCSRALNCVFCLCL